MNDKVKEALETLSNIVHPPGNYWVYRDGSGVLVGLAGKEAEYLSALLAEKTRIAARKLG